MDGIGNHGLNQRDLLPVAAHQLSGTGLLCIAARQHRRLRALLAWPTPMRPGEHARIELCGRGVTVLHGHCWGSFSKDATPHPSLPSCGLWSVRVAALLHSPGWGGLDCALLIDMLDGEGGWMAGQWSWFVLAVEVCGGLGSIAWRELEVLATPGSEASGRSAVELPRYRRVAAAGTFHGPHSAAH